LQQQRRFRMSISSARVHLAERLIVSRISKISELPSMRDYKPTVDIDLIKSFCCIRWIQNLILFVVP
jgi:hypothetical protein